MDFIKHSSLIGQHSFLSGSKYHWMNYNEHKLTSVYTKFLSVQKGVQLHEFAKKCIELSIRLPKNRKSLNQYVNDAIGFRMTPEQVLYFSDNAYGTADAISFRKNLLRIHDLKTGHIPGSIHQLEVYTALFCLEYDYNPSSIEVELRIYQYDEVLVHNPEEEVIRHIMDKIVLFDKLIDQIKSKEELWMSTT